MVYIYTVPPRDGIYKRARIYTVPPRDGLRHRAKLLYTYYSLTTVLTVANSTYYDTDTDTDTE